MSYDQDLAFQYTNPTKIIFGENSVRETGLEVDALGGTRALVVTDEGIVKAGLAARVEEALGRRYAGTYDRCVQDSGFHLVDEAAAFAREKEADILVSVGGGSVIDTAKGMAILLKEGGKLADYKGMQVLSRPQTPHVVVPTTAGTGSEVTWAAVIKDWDLNIKELVASYYLIPDRAILDPVLTAGLPAPLTAATGMDAFTHAVEAIHSIERQPITDGMALQAIKMIARFLPVCVEEGDNLTARGQQQIAATMAGIAFGNAQVCLAHSIAHALGALFGVPHGLANSIILPHVMRFNLEECPDRYALVAEAMGIDTRGEDELSAGKAAIEAVTALTERIKLPQKLREAKVPEEELAKAAELALEDGDIIFNPRPVMDAEEVLNILKEAW